MPAAATDKFMKVGEPGTATTLSAPGYTIGNTSITVASTTNFPTDTGFIFAIDVAELVNNEQVRVPGSYCTFTGVVTGATTIGSVALLDGTPQDYAAGALTRVYISVASEHTNRLMDGILVHADQDGTLKAGAVDNAAVLASDVVTTVKILDGNVTYAKAANGFSVQTVAVNVATSTTGTTTIPLDDTIPQNTEGDEYMTLAITPKSATNKLVISAVVNISNSSANSHLIAALFQDSTANALATNDCFQATAAAPLAIPILYQMTAGTTSAITFKIRAGGNNAGTTTLNGFSGSRKFGGVYISSMVITEYKA